MKGLEGKVALVTGGASGIGRACVEALLNEGVHVMIADINGGQISELLKTHHDKAGFAQLDVRNEEQWANAVQACENKWGRLDILINNAGVSKLSDGHNPETISLDEWRGVNAINTEGVVLGCKYGIAAMRRNGSGSIINMASIGGKFESPLAYPYGASKAAVLHITKTVAVYCARQEYNIRCNAVLPGPIATDMFQKATDEDARRNSLRGIPLARPGTPENIADAVLFLASENAAYVTGMELPVDGGLLAVNPMRVNDEKAAS